MQFHSKLFVLISGLFLSFAALGEPGNVPNEALLRAELRIQAQSILIEFTEELDREMKATGSVAAPKMIRMFQRTTRRILRKYERTTKTPGLADRMWGSFAHLDWNKVIGMADGFRKKVGGTLKKHGPLAAISFALGTTVELVIDSALIVAGMPYLIPVSLCTPYETAIFASTKAVQAQMNRARLAKLYGGMDEMVKVETAQKALRQELHLGAADDLLLPVVERRSDLTGSRKKLVAISETGTLRKALSFFGVRDNRVTLARMHEFFKEKLPASVLPDALARQTDISPRIQTAMMVSHLYQHASPEVLGAFEAKFGESILKRDELRKSHTAKTLAWLEAFATIRTAEELRKQMAAMPVEEVSAKTLMGLWTRILLPRVLANVGDLQYRHAKQLRDAVEPLKADALRSEEMAGESWKQRLTQYVDVALATPAKSWCGGLGWLARGR